AVKMLDRSKPMARRCHRRRVGGLENLVKSPILKRSSIAPAIEYGQPPMPSILLLLAIVVHGRDPQTIVLQGAAQGTTYHIKFVGPRDAVDVERLHADIEKVLAQIDRQMSTYRSDSEISR